jgi:hypothetical protein
VHVTNSSQGFLGVKTTGRERSLQVPDGHEVKVEAVRALPLTFSWHLYLEFE